MPRDAEEDWRGAQPTDEDSSEPSAAAHTIVPRSIADVDPAKIPPRKWIATGRFLRGAVTLTIAPPGTGKTMLAIQEALAIVVGMEWAHLAVQEAAAAWVFNLEEPLEELHRRLVAALDAMGINRSAVKDKFFLNGSEDRLVVARRDQRGAIVATPDVGACVEHIRQLKIGLLVVDPFIECHGLDENSNVEVKAAAAMFRDIAQATDCAVHLVHHTRKPPIGSGEGHVGNPDSARGGSALIGLARVAHTLFSMTKNDADRLGVDEAARWRHLRMDIAKSNYSAPGSGPTWFRREAVVIANGEEVGVLAFADFTEGERQANAQRADRHRSIIARLLAIVVDEMTVNKAGFALIEQRESLFPTFQGKNFGSTCPSPVRGEIEDAVKSGITVNGQSFSLAENVGRSSRANSRAKVLRRTGADLFADD